MNVYFKDLKKSKEILDNSEIKQKEVSVDTETKKMLVDYVGNMLLPEDDCVTLEMVVNVLANEFPELLMLVGEESFFRGYDQALADVAAMDHEPVDVPETTAEEQHYKILERHKSLIKINKGIKKMGIEVRVKSCYCPGCQEISRNCECNKEE